MIKLSRTGITTLKRMYKSVLLKCLLINAGILLATGSANAALDVVTGFDAGSSDASVTTSNIEDTVKGLADGQIAASVADTTTDGALGKLLGAKADAATSANTSLSNLTTGGENVVKGLADGQIAASVADTTTDGALGKLLGAKADAATAANTSLSNLTTGGENVVKGLADGQIAASVADTTTDGALGKLLAGKQDTMVAGVDSHGYTSISISDGNKLWVRYDDSTIGLGSGGLEVKDSGITSAKIADGTIIEDDLADAVKYNLLTHVATSNGLTVTAGADASNPAKIELNLDGSTLVEGTDGLKVNEDLSLKTLTITDGINANGTINLAGTSGTVNLGKSGTDSTNVLGNISVAGNYTSTNGNITTTNGTISGNKLVAGTSEITGTGNVGTNSNTTVLTTAGAYTELRIAADSDYVKAANTTAQNLTALDTGLKDTNLLIGSETAGKGLLDGITISKTAGSGYKNVIDALNIVADSAAGLEEDNKFTGKNTFEGDTTFNNPNGIVIGNQADTTDLDHYKAASIRTTDEGALKMGANTEVNGTLKVGEASAITGTDGTLNMGKNALTDVQGLTLTDGETSPTTAAISVSKVDGVGAVVGIAADAVTSKEFRASGALTVDDGSDKERFVADANGITVGDGTNDTFKVESATGNTTVGGTLGVKGNFAVNTDKFTVTAENGNVTTKGTVEINGATLTGGKDAEENPTLTSSAKVISANGFEVTATTSLAENLLTVGDSSLSNTALTIGKASAITGAENSLDMGKNAVSNVKGLTLTDGETEAKTVALTVNTSGELSVDKIIDATQGLKFSSDTTAMTSVSRGEVAAAVNADNTAIVASATAVQATRAAINAENAGIFGAFYQIKDDATLAYKNDVLVADGFVTGQDDFATSLTNYAANVRAATGGTFDAEGVWTATVSAASANKYEYTPSANLMYAISQVAGNVGLADQLKATDKEGTDKDGVNGVTKDKTVNQNLTALNNTIGDLEGLNEFDDANSQGNAMTNGTGVAPTTVVEALNNIDLTLGSIHGLANKLGADYKGNLAEGTTVEQHLTALDAAIGDRSQFATGRYTATSESVADATMALDRGLGDLADEVRDFKKEYKSGMAQMAAMSALVPNARAHGNTQISVGTGAYQGQTAAAVGAFHWVNDNLLLNAGVSYGNSNNVAYRAGLTWSW